MSASFTYHAGWGELDSAASEEIIGFWLLQQALPSEQAARRRVAQVVTYARSAQGKIAAVSTALPQIPAQLAQPVYFYRSFVAPEWRKSLVVFRLLKHSVKLLENDAREHDWPCIGVLLELENPRFLDKGRMPIWPGIEFTYIGKSPRNLECRVHWFRDARLKPFSP